MKTRIFIFLFLSSIGFTLICNAQNHNKIDSLLNVLKAAKEDTTKVNTLNALGLELTYSNIDTSIILANQALSLSEKAKSKKHIADSYNVIVLADYRIGNYSASLENIFKVLSIRKELDDKYGIANALNMIGNIYSDQSDFPKALEYQFRSLKMREELGNKNEIAKSIGSLGYVYSQLGNQPKAKDYHSRALKMHEELGNKSGIALCLAFLSGVYFNQKDYPKALDYNLKALKIYEELGYKYRVAYGLGGIGDLYAVQSEYPKALNYYFKALKMFEEIGTINEIAGYSCSIGRVYIKTGKFAEAEEYLKKAIAIADSMCALGHLRQFEESLYQLYDTTGRYKLALEHYKKAMVLKDTLFNQEKNKEITRKEMNYEFEKTQAAEKAGHEKQMAVADVAIKKQTLLKNSFIGGLALALALFFFIYNNYRTRQKLKLETIRNNIAADLHDDIGSTLNSISIYSEVARKKDEQQDEALEMIGDASRKIIDAMSDIVWTINPDNDSFVKVIFRMKSLAYNLFRAKKIEFTFHADEILNEKKLSLEERRNFYLIFKEAVNNLVKYSNANLVIITMTTENAYIILRIQDNGVGFDVSEDTVGNGLKNMKRRADEIKAQFKLESSKGNGTQIELNLKV